MWEYYCHNVLCLAKLLVHFSYRCNWHVKFYIVFVWICRNSVKIAAITGRGHITFQWIDHNFLWKSEHWTKLKTQFTKAPNTQIKTWLYTNYPTTNPWLSHFQTSWTCFKDLRNWTRQQGVTTGHMDGFKYKESLCQRIASVFL